MVLKILSHVLDTVCDYFYHILSASEIITNLSTLYEQKTATADSESYSNSYPKVYFSKVYYFKRRHYVTTRRSGEYVLHWVRLGQF